MVRPECLPLHITLTPSLTVSTSKHTHAHRAGAERRQLERIDGACERGKE